ncbi:hypothetical protein BDV41DRAFT_521250, partial [Aspergillus transmontanensis]
MCGCFSQNKKRKEKFKIQQEKLKKVKKKRKKKRIIPAGLPQIDQTRSAWIRELRCMSHRFHRRRSVFSFLFLIPPFSFRLAPM